MKISFIGAGQVASKLGRLFTIAGHHVKYGIRNPADDKVSIAEAIKFGEVVFIAIPYSAVAQYGSFRLTAFLMTFSLNTVYTKIIAK